MVGSSDTNAIFSNPMQATLSGLQLIEASAGTGKTYTISGLFIRLLLEKQLPVEKILVVTFTKSATEELRDRIRKRLVDALLVFTAEVAGETVSSGDELLLTLLENSADPLADLDRLRVALFSFDQVPLLTIHAFSQRVLQDHAFGAAVPFGCDLLEDESELQQQIIDDYWRRQVTGLPRRVLQMLLAAGGVAAISGGLRSWVGKPVLNIPDHPRPSAEAEQLWLQALEQFRTSWGEAEAAREYLLNSPELNRSKLRADIVARTILEYDQLLDGGPLPQYADRLSAEFLLAGDKAKKNKQVKEFPLYHDVSRLLAAHGEFQQWLDDWQRALKIELLVTLRTELKQRKKELRVRGYSDFLSDLNTALLGDSAPQLISSVRNKFAAALVDEFQDTDELQFDNFYRLFVGDEPLSESGEPVGSDQPGKAAMPVFMVGDPKQAIYSFRGADIYAYLNARKQAENSYNLKTNWRSTPELIDAVNTLFLRRGSPFVLDEIDYLPVAAAEKQREQLILPKELGSAAMTLLRLPDSEGKTARTPANSIQESLQHCANTIAYILQAAQNGSAAIVSTEGQRRAVSGGDIAVIIRKNSEGAELQQQLQLRGINAIRTDQASVWHSVEADSVLRLLLAITDPRPPVIRAALATPLFGYTVSTLSALNNDEAAWDDWLLTLRRWRILWQEHGLSRCWQQLCDERQVSARLLRQTGGARQLTNANHITELLAAEAQRQGWDSLTTLQWFQQRIAEPASSDAALLRLDSDDNLVRIVTVHKSKGLEYPLVFCPAAFAEVRDPKGLMSWHGDDGETQLGFAETASDEQLQRHQREQLAEDMRLLYVALTRAAHRCWLYCGAFKTSVNNNALAWLLHGDEDEIGDLSSIVDDAEPAAIAVVDVDAEAEPVVVQPIAVQGEVLKAVEAKRHIYQSWRLTSFTGVLRLLGSEEPGSYAADASDYDQLSGQHASQQQVIGQAEVDPESDSGVVVSEPVGAHAFPRGARAGTCLHWMLEEMNFAAVDTAQLHELVRRGLERYGYSEEWQESAVQMLQQTVATPLIEGVALNQLQPGQWLPEMEFHYPLKALSGDKLMALLKEHDFGVGTAIAERLRNRSFSPVSGYMKGFIDLIFVANGRYYLADYKSNWLGPDDSAYNGEVMNNAIAEADYFLQYLIYSVALQRYLKSRLPNYRYESHFGGCLYLFLRGMGAEPVISNNDEQPGVYFDRPAEALLDSLSQLVG